MPSAAAPPAFVGQAVVLAKVTGAVEHGPALVLIEGEPGIGKTRLLHEALRSEQVANRAVLLTACPPLREPFPLGPLVEGIRRFRDRLHDVELTDLGLSRLCGALRPIFPEWADSLPLATEPLDDPKLTRHRLARALAELVERLGVEVLVIEDAHWADAATLQWLLSLTSAADLTMSVVVTYRPTDVPEDSLLLGLTSRAPPAMTRLRVELEPLNVEHTRQLIGSMFGAEEVSEKFAAFLHEHTDGIPLAVEESVRLLRDRHDIVRHGGRWTRRLLDELEVPPTVRDSVLERVTRLSAEARQVLQAAAVLAEPAAEQLLITVAGTDGTQGDCGIAAALASGLLQEASPGRFVFRHSLDAQAVGEAIPASRWRHLHGRAAAALRSTEPEPVARLARHCREAGDTERWCGYAAASADLALESGDDRTAVETLLQVMNSPELPINRRVRLARQLGQAAFFGAAALGELADQVIRVLRGVLDSGEITPADRGELRLLLGRMLWTVGARPDAFEQWEAAVADLGQRPDLAIRAMSNMALPLVPGWAAAQHRHWLDRAGGLLERVASRDQAAFQHMRMTALLLLGEEAGLEALGTLPDSASTRAEEHDLASTLLNAAWALLAWGRFEDARGHLATSLRHIEAADYSRLSHLARALQTRLDWYAGDWTGLDAKVAELAESEDVSPTSRLHAQQVRGLLKLAAGVRTAAERVLHEVVAEQTQLGVVEPGAVAAPAAVARLHLADADPARALSITDPVVTMIAHKGVWLWITDIAPVHLDALLGTGRLDDAEDFVATFAVELAGRDIPAPAAALMTCRAIATEAADDPGRAADLFAAAARLWAALPRPYDELLSRERQGRALLTAGETSRALQMLADTQQRLHDLGARWDADRVAHLAREHGVEVARTWRGGRRGYGDRLSPRELDVVRLVARGLTNRQAAETLFLSPRTVEGHVKSAMRKLDVRSRTALAIAAVEAGFVSSDAEEATGRG